MNDNKDNVLIYKERPYFTKEERILYIIIAIDEAEKKGLTDVANHYRILLQMIENDTNELYNFLMSKNKGR